MPKIAQRVDDIVMRLLYQRLDGTVRMKTFFFLKWGTHPRISQLIRLDCSVFVTRSHLIQESRVSMAQKVRSGYRSKSLQNLKFL